MNDLIIKALREQVIEKLESNVQIMEIVQDTIGEVTEENAFDLTNDTTWDAMMEIASNVAIR